MDNPRLRRLLMSWKRLGMELDCPMAREHIDIESVLLETAKLLPEMARLLPVSLTWLMHSHPLIARSRLQQMASQIEDLEQSACLGLLLSMAQEQAKADHLSPIIRTCRPMSPAVAMLRSERHEAYRALVEHEAHPLSRQWGILAPMPELKEDAIRPLDWVLQHNPQLRLRAMFGGNLRASILAAIAADPNTGQSESMLAHAVGATRKAVRDALDHLEFCGLVARNSTGRSVQIQLRDVHITIG